MATFGVPIELRRSTLVAHVQALEPGLRERLALRGLSGSVRLAATAPAPAGTELIAPHSSPHGGAG